MIWGYHYFWKHPIYRFMSRISLFFFRLAVSFYVGKFWGHFSLFDSRSWRPLRRCWMLQCDLFAPSWVEPRLGYGDDWWMETKGRNGGGELEATICFVEGDGIDGMILSICVFFVVDENWYQVSDKIQLIKNMLDKVRRTVWWFHWRSWKMFHT